MSILSFEPVVDGTVVLTLDPVGWWLCERHRHRYGTWGDCELDTYGPLVWREALDLLEVLTGDWAVLRDPESR